MVKFTPAASPQRQPVAVKSLKSPARTAAVADVVSTLRQAVAQGTFSGSSTQVPTTGLAAGTYVLTVQPTGEQAVTNRVSLR